jgi:methionyl-tRNA synthetase
LLIENYQKKYYYKPLTIKNMEQITIDDVKKLEIRIGTIKIAERIEKSEKLLRLEVEFQDGEVRQILSGIAQYYAPEDIVGKQCPFVYNLAPRSMMGLESNGMILGIGGEVGFVALHPSKDVPSGSLVG